MNQSYHEDVIGSHVVFDPTGRDLADCMKVGRVIAITWNSDDDGNLDGSPRPILLVQPNGTDTPDATVAVTVVHNIIPRRGPRFSLHPNEDGLDHADSEYIR